MTARLSAAESFLLLLDDLPSVTKPKSNTDVLLKHAADHIRDLLSVVDDLRRELAAASSVDAVADAELDELLHRAAEHANARCPEHGLMCKGEDCCCAHRHPDVPRPDDKTGTEKFVASQTGPAAPDLSHLPPMAADAEDMCRAESLPDGGGMTWACNARRGHPERWHAAYGRGDVPSAAEFSDAAWPVAAKETGLPRWADGGFAPHGTPAFGAPPICGAMLPRSQGAWMCNAVPDHAPADHVAFGAWESARPGMVLARWASVRPGDPCDANRPDHDDITEEEHAEAVAYLLGKHGGIPPSLQRVIDMGGRIKHVPRPGQDAELITSGSITAPGHPDGHALRPPGPPAELRPGEQACGCQVVDNAVRHMKATCTDPVVAKLNWYYDGDGPPAPHPVHFLDRDDDGQDGSNACGAPDGPPVPGRLIATSNPAEVTCPACQAIVCGEAEPFRPAPAEDSEPA